MAVGPQRVKAPPFKVGLRPEHISEFDRLLYLRPRYDKEAVDEMAIKFDSNNKTVFTASGTHYNRKGVREFRDASGLPLFECEKMTIIMLRRRGPWLVRLPGSKPGDETSNIATTHQPRASLLRQFDLTFRNAVQDANGDDGGMITLQVRQTHLDIGIWSVSVGDRVVVHIRESLERNAKNPWTGRLVGGSQRNTRMVLDVMVAENFDLSLVSFRRIYFSSLC